MQTRSRVTIRVKPQETQENKTMTTESRREFEEWARNSVNLISPWEAWQAARAKQSEIICRKCGLREERGEKPSFDF